jgi:hypothetical protein
MPTQKELRELVHNLKEKSKEAFKGLTQASTAENIAECRPDEVIDAEGFLSWLVEKKMLKKEHLQHAMDNLEPAVKWVTRDKQGELIKKIVEDMRTRPAMIRAPLLPLMVEEGQEGSALKRGDEPLLKRRGRQP